MEGYTMFQYTSPIPNLRPQHPNLPSSFLPTAYETFASMHCCNGASLPAEQVWISGWLIWMIVRAPGPSDFVVLEFTAQSLLMTRHLGHHPRALLCNTESVCLKCFPTHSPSFWSSSALPSSSTLSSLAPSPSHLCSWVIIWAIGSEQFCLKR